MTIDRHGTPPRPLPWHGQWYQAGSPGDGPVFGLRARRWREDTAPRRPRLSVPFWIRRRRLRVPDVPPAWLADEVARHRYSPAGER